MRNLRWSCIHFLETQMSSDVHEITNLLRSSAYIKVDLQAIEAARQFNASWDSDIQLLRHDCHHHTAELVQALTGESVDVWKLFPMQQRTLWL